MNKAKEFSIKMITGESHLICLDNECTLEDFAKTILEINYDLIYARALDKMNAISYEIVLNKNHIISIR